VGLNEVIVGTPAAETVNVAALVMVPSVGSATDTVPVVAPHGTAVVIDVSETTVNDAAVPLNFTDVAAPPVMKLVPLPVIVTAVPGAPEIGKKVIDAAA
jgi:hypothetical protein